MPRSKWHCSASEYHTTSTWPYISRSECWCVGQCRAQSWHRESSRGSAGSQCPSTWHMELGGVGAGPQDPTLPLAGFPCVETRAPRPCTTSTQPHVQGLIPVRRDWDPRVLYHHCPALCTGIRPCVALHAGSSMQGYSPQGSPHTHREPCR